jgi:pyruvate, water dikinase
MTDQAKLDVAGTREMAVVDVAYTRWFEDVTMNEIGIVGGKNASLGEMTRALKSQGIRVPEGFATTAGAYWKFIEANGIRERMEEQLAKLKKKQESLSRTGTAIRKLFLEGEFPEEVAKVIRNSYLQLCKRYAAENVDVAVRSSATAEDLPDASFAGQQESFLNITGEKDLLDACRKCFASLFTDRAISYRIEKGFDHMQIALSIGVQKMVRSDKDGAGVIFTLDTETGFPRAVIINAAWGLGEYVVKGTVTPDQYTVFKPLLEKEGCQPIIDKKLGDKAQKLVYAAGGSHATRGVPTPEKQRRAFVLNDNEIIQLAKWACVIERHYRKPMDIEFAKDGETHELFIVQARPETVQSRNKSGVVKTYRLRGKGPLLLKGVSIGDAIAAAKVCRVLSVADIGKVEPGCILVTEMTDPDWVPVMKKVAGIITDFGGRTCHAAIVSRELGIPAIVGTGDATHQLENKQEITLSCAEGDQGLVYEGLLPFEATEVDMENIPETRTRIMMNMASPDEAFRWWRLPCKGIGLARMEFIIDNIIKIHPMALVRFNQLKDQAAKVQIRKLTRGYEDVTEYFVDHLARGIAKIAAAQYPEPVIVRMSDFKTNEYANLIGGKQFEPQEENPMIGFRGASRYYSQRYREGFALECRAIRKVREQMGFTNVVIMIPFCRTLKEADDVHAELARNGLKRGVNDLQVYVMCEIPSNVILADEFAQRFDGFSIGSNDLTQLVLGVDRDSADLAYLFDERNDAVKKMIRDVIANAHTAGCKVGICGQAPSDYPEFAEFLVDAGIDSISLNPDSVIQTKTRIADFESAQRTFGKRNW